MTRLVDEIAELKALSARIGREPLLVQAGGGNTSIKHDGTLWVKASGTWLIRAEQEDLFVPAPIAELRHCIETNVEYAAEYTTAGGAVLRPSVETTMHAQMPHHTVIHVHSVNTIAWAIREDAELRLDELLAGLRWAWIPYIHPGLPLTRSIAEIAGVDSDLLVLGNHGLVVGGDCCASAEALLRDVERRLAIEPATGLGADQRVLRALAGESGWMVPSEPTLHAIATGWDTGTIASGGTLYPDHCVYLGPGCGILQARESFRQALDRYTEEQGIAPRTMIAPGKGILVAPDLKRAGWELLGCLAGVVARCAPDVPVRYLRPESVAALMNWDAEKYRISLAQ